MSKLAVLLFILCFASYGFSQDETYKFTHISTTEGLSQSSAIVIHQDSLGQIWIGTRDGLNKYDGTEFTVYRNEKDNPYSISNNDILSLEIDSSGFIWIGSVMGLNKYNPKKDTFTRYFANNNGTSITNNFIFEIKELSTRELWVGTRNGLSIYDKLTDSFKSFLIGTEILSVFETKNGSIFIGTSERGLIEVERKSKNDYEFKTIKGTEGFIIQEIVECPNGNLLLGTVAQSVLEYDSDLNVLKPYFEEVILKGKNRNVRQMLFDNQGALWMGTYNGLQIADKDRNIKNLSNNINDDESINDNFIKALFKDVKGSIWVGTYNGGINIWDESNVNFINITQKPGNTGLAFKALSAIVNHDDLIFFGTEGGGVSVLNTSTKAIEHMNTKNTSSFKNDNVKDLFLTKDKKLWIGTFRDGIAIYDVITQRFDNTSLSAELLSYIKDVAVFKIYEHVDGDMLIGTTGKGLIKYNIANKSFKVFDRNTKPNSISNVIRGVNVDSKNNIWVSTNEGLNVIDTNEEIRNYFYDSELKTGYGMSSIFEDSNGVMWFGADADGLFKFVNNNFEHVSIKMGNTPLIGVRSMIEDDKGNLWISSANQGIINYNPKDEKVVSYYTEKQGLPSNQFHNNTSLSIGSSQFFFGGPEGAIYFNPNKLVKNTYVPQVVITDLKIKNKSVSVNDDTQLLNNAIAFTEYFELSHDQGNFSISFSIPSFINSSSNRYMYRLKGLENEWVETSQNSAAYTIQSPGSYTFEVKGINSDGVSNDMPTTVKIQVNPAPWRTWWAFILYGIFIFATLYYFLNILNSKTKLKHQLDLEHQQAEQANEVNKAKLEFFTNVSHEFRTPLTLILGPLHQILENYRGSSLMYKKLKVIEGSSNHLLQLINRLMDFRKLENNLVKLEAAEGNIVKFLKEIYLSFSEYAKDGNYDYSFHTPADEILVFYDRYKLERVFYNLISNAFRYTPKNGKIALRIIQKKEKICIQVEDSGVGVAKEYHDKIFERFFELSINRKPDNDYNKGTGIGLSIVKNIIDLHKGEITVRNNENDIGTIFSVELPLGRAYLEDAEIIQDFKFSEDLSQYVSQLDESEVILEDDILENIKSEEKPTILLVEDNKSLRKFMRDFLAIDYNIFEAENGKIGFKIAQKEHIDIIVSDVIMPVMTGTELCSLVKENIRTSHIPVILLTSRSSLIFKLEGLESGADDYISKPFNVDEFKLRIKNILSSISRLKQKTNSVDLLHLDNIVQSSLDEKLYIKALQIVENNISNEAFDTLMFCEELGVSRSDLFRKIKAWTDFTPKEFVLHVRLKKSAQLLEQGKMNISQICYKVGFKNPKYFSKCFREKFDKSPTEYAKTFSDS